MKRIIPLFVFSLLCCFSVAQAGAHHDMNVVKKTIKKNIPNLKIDDIRPLPEIAGLYEIRSGNQIYYSDRTGKHLLLGHILRTKGQVDLTGARLEEINKVDWKVLPLKDAIVSGDPKGIPVAVFTDPECPYCRKLEKVLLHTDGLKIYTFLFPLIQLHPDSHKKADAIWCAKDQHAALLDVMIYNKDITAGKSSSCTTPVARNVKLGRSLGINGTPTLIAKNGHKHAGLMSKEALIAWANKK